MPIRQRVPPSRFPNYSIIRSMPEVGVSIFHVPGGYLLPPLLIQRFSSPHPLSLPPPPIVRMHGTQNSE